MPLLKHSPCEDIFGAQREHLGPDGADRVSNPEDERVGRKVKRCTPAAQDLLPLAQNENDVGEAETISIFRIDSIPRKAAKHDSVEKQCDHFPLARTTAALAPLFGNEFTQQDSEADRSNTERCN